LFHRDADLVFFDTTSTYFEIRDPDEEDLRQYGHPHCHRGDRPQILIGLAVNEEGLPLASEVFPGNTADVSTVKKMIGRMKKIGLKRCIFVSDRGTVSQDNIESMKQAGLDDIIGVKLRSTQEVKEEVLLSPDDYIEVSENLKVKEVWVKNTRYIVCYNPKEQRKDIATRNKWITRIESLLPSINSGKKNDHEITNHMVMKRLVTKNNEGHLVLNYDKIRQEERCDGIYVVSTSTDLPIHDVAKSYKMLQRVERAFHYIKSFVEIRPCYHRAEIRIKAHVLLCVLTYLIERWTEIQTGYTWSTIQTHFGKIHAVEVTVNQETFVQRSSLNETVTQTLKTLKIKYPNKILR
jgi:transposase